MVNALMSANSRNRRLDRELKSLHQKLKEAELRLQEKSPEVYAGYAHVCMSQYMADAESIRHLTPWCMAKVA